MYLLDTKNISKKTSKRTIILGLTASLLLSACNSPKTATDGNDTQSKITPKTQQVQLSEIKGSDFEPPWSIVIGNTHMKDFSFTLTTMMGQKKTTGNISLSNEFIISPDARIELKGTDDTGKAMLITYTQTQCLNMAGEDEGGMLNIQWGEQKLTGCGRYSVKTKP